MTSSEVFEPLDPVLPSTVGAGASGDPVENSASCLTAECKLGGEPYCWSEESFDEWDWRRVAPNDVADWPEAQGDYTALNDQVDARVARTRVFASNPSLTLFADPTHALAVNERFEYYFDDNPETGSLCIESDPTRALSPTESE